MIDPCVRHILLWKNNCPLQPIQEELVVSYWLKNGHLILLTAFGRLVQEQCDKITDHPNMTSAVYLGRKALNQTSWPVKAKKS